MTIELNPPVKKNILSLGGLISGIAATISMLIGWYILPIVGHFLGIILSIVAVIMGSIALPQIKKSEGAQRGRGVALVGVILGVMNLIVFTVLLVIVVIALIEFE